MGSHFQNYNSRQVVLKHLSVKSCLPPVFTKILRETNMKFATRQAASVALRWCLEQQHKGFLRLRLLFRKNLRLPAHFRKVACDSSKVTVGTFTVSILRIRFVLPLLSPNSKFPAKLAQWHLPVELSIPALVKVFAFCEVSARLSLYKAVHRCAQNLPSSSTKILRCN